MRIKYGTGIESMSGSIKEKNGSTIIYKHMKGDKPGYGRMYLMPRGTYQRKTKPTEKEMHARNKFAQASYYAAFMPTPLKEKYAEQWRKNKYQLNGKKYCTLRGYIMACYYANCIITND